MNKNDDMEKWLIATFGRRAAGEAVESDETLPSICPLCGDVSDTIAKRRRNTAYLDDKNNWLISCKACFEEDYENFQELWEMIIIQADEEKI